MVFFTCFHCGESVKKPAVSKHYDTKCRNRQPYLTCVDCLKDFKGNEYEAHTKCLTEEERYSAKGFVPKPSQNKGERKQQAWYDCIQEVLKKPTLKPDERELISAISKQENVPRKKNKFLNFLNNAFKQYVRKKDLIDRVWIEMESVFKEMSEKDRQQQGNEKKSNENQNEEEKPPEKVEENEKKKEKKKKKKRKAEENEVTETPETDNGNEKSKKKKAKYSEENVMENKAPDVNGTDKSQKKKDKKRNADENEETEGNVVAADEGESRKKKKKKKKGNENSENDVKENTEPAEIVSKKKKKKEKKLKNDEVEGEGETEGVGECNGTQSKAEKKAESDVKTGKSGSKKKKSGDNEEEQEEFNWKAVILKVINQKGKNNKIELQKLQENVFKVHSRMFSSENSNKKAKTFMKKLKKIPQIKISDNLVELQS